MIVCNFSWSSPLRFFLLLYDKSYKYVLLIFRLIPMAYEPTFHDVLIIPYFIWNHVRIFLSSSNNEKKKVYVLFSFFSSSFVSQIKSHLLHRLKKKREMKNKPVCTITYIKNQNKVMKFSSTYRTFLGFLSHFILYWKLTRNL